MKNNQILTEINHWRLGRNVGKWLPVISRIDRRILIYSILHTPSIKSMSSEDDDSEQTKFISHLRTVIILAARKSSSTDIDIDAIDKIVETTIDFVKKYS